MKLTHNGEAISVKSERLINRVFNGTILEIQVKLVQMEVNGTHQLLKCAADINYWAKTQNTIKKDRQTDRLY